MKRDEIKVLKNFMKEIKIPKVFYLQNLNDLIDNHMIILSQIDSLIHNEDLNPKLVNIMSEDDQMLIEELSKSDIAIKDYLEAFENVVSILNKYI